jgi:formylglycine-generating enzyme required for sulfatase activity
MNHAMTGRIARAVALCGMLALIGCGGDGGEKTSAAARSLSSEMTVDVGWVTVPPGNFTMGSDRYAEKLDKEKVIKSDEAFQIMKTPVTNAMFKKWLDKLPAADKEKYTPKEDRLGRGGWKDGWYPMGEADCPVTNIDYLTAKKYAEDNGWDLPTSAEWEKAARGMNDNRDYPWGSSIDPKKASYGDPRGKPAKVTAHPDNVSPFGALEMCGNVWEWTKSPFDRNNPGRERMMAGGSFSGSETEAMVHSRKAATPDEVAFDNGFRCVKKGG